MFIVVANQWLFGLGMFLVFKLARRWFNNVAAWMCALLFLFTELYWRFTVSGLSTILLMDLILLLVMLLSRFDERSRNAESKLFWNAVAIGLVNGLAMLTRYSLGWLILPVLIFTFLCGGQKRGALTAATLGAFVLVVAPWMVRNVMLSGLPFGTATYAVFETTPAFSGDTMSRTIVPSFTGLPGQSWILFVTVLHKGINGVREIISSDLPRLGGNWLWSFFLVGLLVRFQNGNLRHLRWFVVGSLLLLIPVQALTRTHLASESPEITSENLLVLFSPLVLIFGVGIFFVLFDFLPLTTLALRFATLSAFVIVISLPFALALLPSRVAPFAPPYYPPRIQQVARYMNDNELWMSDIPWAVAWYGERKCVWLTLNWNADFFKISDYERTVNGLFISTRTTDLKFYSGLIVGDNRNWADFLWQTFVRREIPDRFPLKYAPEGTLLPHGELLLTDRERWAAPMGGAENLKKD
jgi:4-amino-4-deoxy-L-arabinose transferase-like glycosyltransferase